MKRGTTRSIRSALVGLAAAVMASAAAGQQAPPKPPAVGVVAAMRQPVTQSSEYIGRIQATERVNLVARVAAFLEERLFTEGAEVKKGDLLYRLEQGPFRADVQAKEATVAQFKAQLENAQIVLGRSQGAAEDARRPAIDRRRRLRQRAGAGGADRWGPRRSSQQSQINLGYTEIRAPIDGKIGRTAVTDGNFVSPQHAARWRRSSARTRCT